MTASDLIAALVPVVECLDAIGVRYYVTGSLASSAHGVARASLDVDLMAELEIDHIERLTDCLGSAYYILHGHIRAAVEQRRSFNLVHFATMFKVDVFISRRRPFDEQAVNRARSEALDEAVDAPKLPIASAEDTVLAKLRSRSRKTLAPDVLSGW